MKAIPGTKKSLGQHWLTDTATLTSICDAADVQATDTVLEIGPGPGTLTALLVKQAHKVVAVEFDRVLAEDLPKRVHAANLKVVHQDIMSFDLTTLPSHYKVVANIPYYLTSNLLRTLSESNNPPQSVALLIQKEVAERVTAQPGQMSLLSVSAQYYWETSLGPVVLAEMFTPPPKVDSQVLIMQYRNSPLFDNVDTRAFFQVVKAGFSARRKTLLNSLSGGLRLSKEDVKLLLEKAEVLPSSRPQELSLAEWFQIYTAHKQ